MAHIQKISTCLWFDRNAEDAAKFYTSVFRNSRITGTSRYEFESPHTPPKGTVMTISLEIEGQQFLLLNGGPMYKFTEAVSFFVHCKDQAEIDHFWEQFSSDGGQPIACGWIKDRFGLCWQVVPENIEALMSGSNSARVMQALMGMTKLDKAALEAAGR